MTTFLAAAVIEPGAGVFAAVAAWEARSGAYPGAGRGTGATAVALAAPRSIAAAMTQRFAGDLARARSRLGFTMLELLLVIVIIGILGALAFPQISMLTGKSSVARAAQVVQQDLQRAFALSARLRKPVTLTADNTARIYQVTDAAGSVLLTRRLAPGQDIGVQTMTFSPTTVTIQPNGVSSAAIGVTLTSNGSTRQVSMTRVGLVQRTQ